MAEAARHSTVLDSAQQHLGKVYAKALLGAADKAGVVEQVLDEFQAFQADLLDALPGFEALLASPRSGGRGPERPCWTGRCRERCRRRS
jgi:F-type H+-transporting ATPase subunit delta